MRLYPEAFRETVKLIKDGVRKQNRGRKSYTQITGLRQLIRRAVTTREGFRGP